MKKGVKFLVIGIFIISNNVTGQDLVTVLNENGTFEIEVISEIPNKTNSEIYEITLEWIAYNFQNTESVIQSQIDNKMIRLQGISNNVIDGPMNFIYGLGYVIQIDVKEGKIKFRVYDIDFIGADATRTRSSMEESILKNGEIRKGKMYIGFKNDTDKELNRIFINFIESLTKENDTNDDW